MSYEAGHKHSINLTIAEEYLGDLVVGISSIFKLGVMGAGG